MEHAPYHKRDTSWLAFNHRVLQEAKDPAVPLYERIKFLAIYSSNLDEFYRVRVSAIRHFKDLKREDRLEWLDLRPKKELKHIKSVVHQQQTEFGSVFRNQIIPALRQQHIQLINDFNAFTPTQLEFAAVYFREKVLPLLHVTYIGEEDEAPFLENQHLHFVVNIDEVDHLGLVNIPTESLPRFQVLPSGPDDLVVTFLDEIIRANLHLLFAGHQLTAFSIKISRDGELYLDEEYSGDLVEKIKESLNHRNAGSPTRLLYDSAMSITLTKRLKQIFHLKKNDLFPGGRYHNFNNFFGFPAPENAAFLHDEAMPPLPHPRIAETSSMMAILDQEELLFHFPYQRYDYIVRLLEEAAIDPAVESIQITLYRVASQSAVVKALLLALENGKFVFAFVEAKARFDEASNLFWGQALEQAGATVHYSKPKIKVHSKIFLIRKKITGGYRDYAYLGTGNFNEKTAKIYGDHALLTTDSRLTAEVEDVFAILKDQTPTKPFEHLLVSPINTRSGFVQRIQREIEHAQAGKPAYMIIKMNSLEDLAMVDYLYAASGAGVKIQLIIRGICCLVADEPGWSENIEVISIIDRYLEHARVYIFGNGGDEELLLASADWMTRNLDRRVEVVFPIYNQKLRQELRHIINFQLADNTKSRYIDASLTNPYKERHLNQPAVRSQRDTYFYLKDKLETSQE
jgi:polyphosphate kinase